MASWGRKHWALREASRLRHNRPVDSPLRHRLPLVLSRTLQIGTQRFCSQCGRPVTLRWHHAAPRLRIRHVGHPFPPSRMGC